MLIARSVLVGDDGDDSAAQELTVLDLPAPGAAGVAGGDRADELDGVDVLLALDDVDGAAGLCRLDHLREPVEDTANVSEFPLPLAVHLAPLAEVLGGEADDLK